MAYPLQQSSCIVCCFMIKVVFSLLHNLITVKTKKQSIINKGEKLFWKLSDEGRRLLTVELCMLCLVRFGFVMATASHFHENTTCDVLGLIILTPRNNSISHKHTMIKVALCWNRMTMP